MSSGKVQALIAAAREVVDHFNPIENECNALIRLARALAAIEQDSEKGDCE